MEGNIGRIYAKMGPFDTALTYNMILIRMIRNASDTIRSFVIFGGYNQFCSGFILCISYIEYIDDSDSITGENLWKKHEMALG